MSAPDQTDKELLKGMRRHRCYKNVAVVVAALCIVATIFAATRCRVPSTLLKVRGRPTAVFGPSEGIVAVTDSAESRISIFSTDSRQLLETVPAREGICCLAIDSDEERMASGTFQGDVQCWVRRPNKLWTEEAVCARGECEDPILSLAFARVGHSLAIVTRHALTVWNPTSGERHSTQLDTYQCQVVATGCGFATCGINAVSVWTPSAAPVQTLSPPPAGVLWQVLSQDGHHLLQLPRRPGSSVRMYSIPDLTLERELVAPDVASGAVSEHGDAIGVGGANVQIWGADHHVPIFDLHGGGLVCGISSSADYFLFEPEPGEIRLGRLR